jgi:hypothetical protein
VQNGPAPFDNPAHIASLQGNKIPVYQTLVAVADTEHLPAFIEAGSYNSPDGSVHTRGIAAAGQYSNSLCHITS